MSGKINFYCVFCVFLIFALSEVANGQYRNIANVIGKPMFNAAVLRSKKPAVVFYYSSSECQVCTRTLLPMLDNLAEKNSAAVRVLKVDVDRVGFKEEHGVTRIPTTMTYFEGDVVDVAEGPFWGGIVALVNNAAKLQQ